MTISDEETGRLAEEFLAACRAKGILASTAESCTGGLIIGALTEIAGCSDVVDRGFITYSNEAKRDMLGVHEGVIVHVGAVSEEVARAMAEGAIAQSRAGIALAVTGIAGPSGGSPDKPVGTVWFGVCRRGGTTIAERRVFAGNRETVRKQTVAHALRLGLGLI